MTRLETLLCACRRACVAGVGAAALAGCMPSPLLVYDFDTGTTQGWKVVSSVHDDKGVAYQPLLFTVSHFEGAQYPGHFPGGDPLNDKKGVLFVNGYQLGPWAQVSGFPATSEYWETSVYYSGLNVQGSQLWQGIKGVKAAVGDMYGATPGHVRANLGVAAMVAGKNEFFRETDANGQLLFHVVNHASTGQWSHITANLSIPANADVYMVFVELRGDWKNYHTYEGGIMIDQVEPIK
jgi:hypothetical protein